MKLQIKRAYDAPGKADGFRILIDRLWPRGLTKGKVAADLWLKEIAPSTELRKWFDHDPEKWTEFVRRYKAELKAKEESVAVIKKHLKEGMVTLVYGAKDEVHNDAVALKDFLEGR